uniref:hypothetical protein n=1 Tax=Nocardia asiatica TaxID=209252 RepID=UPI00245693C3
DPAQPLSAVATEVAAQIRELKRYERFPYGDLARALSSDPTAPPSGRGGGGGAPHGPGWGGGPRPPRRGAPGVSCGAVPGR